MPPQLPPVGPPPQQRGRPKGARGQHTEGKGYSGAASSMSGTRGPPPRQTHRQLWQHCEAVLTSFSTTPSGEGVTDTVDSHTTQYLARHPGLNDMERAFVQQVFYGCSRYRPMLHAVVRRYLTVKVRMNDCFVPFVILTYLAMFRVDELGVATFRSLIAGCSSHSRVAEYLQFLFTRASAEQYFASEWKRIFDDAYVDRVLLGHIDSFSEPMLEIAAGFEALATGQEDAERQAAGAGGRGGGGGAKPSTVAAPFKLTQPARRPVAEPEPPPPPPRQRRPADGATEATVAAIAAYRAGRVASTLSPTLAATNREREGRRPFQPPALHALHERPRNIDEVRRKMEADLEERVRPEFASRPGPEEVRRRLARQPPESRKQTAAALLREDAVWRRRDEEAQAALRKKETEMRDDTEFREWQTKMLGQDDAEARALVAQRKVEMMLADEEARAARRRQERRNAREATLLKEEISEKLARKDEEDAAEQEANRRLARVMKQQLHDGVEQQREKLLGGRKEEAKSVREEDRMLELKLAETMELELRRKADIIKKIRAEAEALKYDFDTDGKRKRKQYKANFDPTTTMQMGTLDEMSLAELRVKLQEVTQERSLWREGRAEDIQQQRESRRDEAGVMAERVRSRREAEQVQKEALRDAKRREREEERERQQKREEERLVALQGKLQERREERQRDERVRRQQEQARVLQQQYKAADKGAVERKKWEGMEKGMERVMHGAQCGRIADGAVKAETSAKLHATREHNTQARIAASRHFRAQQKQRVRDDAALLDTKMKGESALLAQSATAERSRRAEARKFVQTQDRDVMDALDSLTAPAQC